MDFDITVIEEVLKKNYNGKFYRPMKAETLLNRVRSATGIEGDLYSLRRFIDTNKTRNIKTVREPHMKGYRYIDDAELEEIRIRKVEIARREEIAEEAEAQIADDGIEGVEIRLNKNDSLFLVFIRNFHYGASRKIPSLPATAPVERIVGFAVRLNEHVKAEESYEEWLDAMSRGEAQ